MGLLGKLMGTRPAKEGVAPLPVEQLRADLLALCRPGTPWHVRDGTDEGCDLVAEWRIVDAAWTDVFNQASLSKAFRVLMKLEADTHEVRNIDEQTSIEQGMDGAFSFNRSWTRGQINETDHGLGVGYTERGEDGTLFEYHFSTREIKDPLRDAVTDRGWGWKAVGFRF